ncbi:MAG: radical SAM protein [Clostridia bacterium]|nr:radical SAM protein [Clostridia bacterium]
MTDKKYSRVYVEITNICNRSCSFCPGTVRPNRRMTLDEFKTVANALVGITDYIYFHVMGEPLTHPELPAMISYATSLGFKCAITTNGTLLDSRGDELIASGAYKVNLSVHSFEEGSEEAHLSYLDSLCRFADKASNSGVLTVLRLWNKGHDGGLNDKTLDFIKSHLDGEWKWGSRGARIRHKLHIEYGDRFEWPDMGADFIGESVFCYGLRDHFGILCDGRVIPCCLDREGKITLGNAFETPVRDILSSSRAEAILGGFDRRCAVEELCKRCGYATRFK